MAIVKLLYQLQEVDLELESNEKSQAQIVSKLGDSREVARVRVELEAEQKQLNEFQQQQNLIEWEIDDLTSKITANEEKLYGGKVTNPKELTNLQHEDEELKTRRTSLEDKVLDIMDSVERSTSSVVDLTEKLGKLEAEWQVQQEQLSAELAHLKTAHTELKQKQAAISAEIEPQVLEIYHELRIRKGIAVARVEQGTCRGCQIALPASNLQQVKSGNLVRCNTCERILYLA